MADAAIHGHDHDERGFFVRWFMSTNHKDIGILYLFTAAVVGLISVIFTVYMRMELMQPGVQYMCEEGMRLIAATAGAGSSRPAEIARLPPGDPAPRYVGGLFFARGKRIAQPPQK